VAGPDHSIVEGRYANGRGAWVCREDPACYERAVRSASFDRALRRPGGDQPAGTTGQARSGSTTS